MPVICEKSKLSHHKAIRVPFFLNADHFLSITVVLASSNNRPFLFEQKHQPTSKAHAAPYITCARREPPRSRGYNNREICAYLIGGQSSTGGHAGTLTVTPPAEAHGSTEYEGAIHPTGRLWFVSNRSAHKGRQRSLQAENWGDVDWLSVVVENPKEVRLQDPSLVGFALVSHQHDDAHSSKTPRCPRKAYLLTVRRHCTSCQSNTSRLSFVSCWTRVRHTFIPCVNPDTWACSYIQAR